MFPRVGSQISTEPGSPEDFHVMEVKNVSRDRLSMAGYGAGARRNLARRAWRPWARLGPGRAKFRRTLPHPSLNEVSPQYHHPRFSSRQCPEDSNNARPPSQPTKLAGENEWNPEPSV